MEIGTMLRSAWQNLRYWTREYMGENDYPRYVREWQAAHQGGTCGHDHEDGREHRMMTPREYYQFRLEIRYNPTMQRC